MREHVDRVLHVVVQGQPVLDVEGVVQVTILQKQFIGCVQNSRIFREKLGDNIFGPLWAIQVIVDCFGQFGVFWATLDYFGATLAERNFFGDTL